MDQALCLTGIADQLSDAALPRFACGCLRTLRNTRHVSTKKGRYERCKVCHEIANRAWHQERSNSGGPANGMKFSVPDLFDEKIRNHGTLRSFVRLRDGIQLHAMEIRALMAKGLASFDNIMKCYRCEPLALARFNEIERQQL